MSAATLVLGPARLAFAQAVYPSWSFTGSLNTDRAGHTATLLQDGKVLVADQSAELYDPASGTWSYTGRPISGGGSATLLQNGKVLVAGGGDDARSSELYDSATGTWSITGNLNIARVGHTTTLLPNGKVLVAGAASSFPSSSTFDSAELYDPASGTWTYTGSLNTGRWDHTATLLLNGKVLVAGGCSLGETPCFSRLNSAELYDAATGTWSYTGSLNTVRNAHTATLLSNGKVLIVGGYSGGRPGAEVYDPSTGTWTYTGDLNSVNSYFIPTATLLFGGKVLVAGVEDGRGSELYDPATDTWSITASMNTVRQGHSATLLPNSKVLVAGGYDPNFEIFLNSAELYDPGTNPNSNPIDDAQFFVRQHYRDFLNREPDADGLAFWINEITSCGSNAQCIDVKRINVSAAFFLSMEFQQSGYLVYRFYKASFGNLPNSPVPIKLNEFLPDAQQIGRGVIVGQAGWETVLENNKQSFASQFVQRSRFASAYSASLSPAQFVDALFATAGVVPSASDRAAVINEFGSATTTADATARARALRRVAENSALAQQEFNRAFVLMQYFGYLRRNPNDPPEPTLDFQGYNFWLNKLNQFNGNFIQAEMVKAFISATEYRQRFGQP